MPILNISGGMTGCADPDQTAHYEQFDLGWVYIVWSGMSVRKFRQNTVSKWAAQNVRFHIVLRMRKVSSGHLLPSETFYSIKWFCLRTAKALIRLRAQSHPGICFPVKPSIVSNDSVYGQRRPWSDCARKVSSWHLLPNWNILSIKWFCLRTAKALIRLRGCAGWSGPSLTAYARRRIFARRGSHKTHLSRDK